MRLADGSLRLAGSTSAADYLDAHLSLLRQSLDQNNSLAAQQLPKAELSSAGLKGSLRWMIPSKTPRRAKLFSSLAGPEKH